MVVSVFIQRFNVYFAVLLVIYWSGFARRHRLSFELPEHAIQTSSNIDIIYSVHIGFSSTFTTRFLLLNHI